VNVVGKYRYYMDSAGEHGRLPIIVDIILVRSPAPALSWRGRVRRGVVRYDAMRAESSSFDRGQQQGAGPQRACQLPCEARGRSKS